MLLWVMQRVMGNTDISGQPVGPTFRSWMTHEGGTRFLTLEGGPVGCPKMSARNYHYLLYNNPAGHSSQDSKYVANSNVSLSARSFIKF